jgi:glycerophosphoryl diester phosphodiesterase
MYENFPPLARKGVDVIIGCSHQRSDTHQALEIIGRFLCYNTNAYLLRSSISLGEDSPICGCSMAVSPDGTMLGNMYSKVGILTVEFDPTKKYYKKKGFYGTTLLPHYKYIDDGRRPWLYRPGGSAMVPQDKYMKYPRVCAHRGFNTIAPENSLPAFGAAVSLGAEEIEFDLWATKDNVLVSIHDEKLDRTSDGEGKISEYTYQELLNFDFGIKSAPPFKGLKIITFEEILKKFACQVIMNIHVKLWEHGAPNPMIDEILGLIKKYDCEQHVYLMCCDDEIALKVKERAPEMPICVGWDGDENPLSMVERAIKVGAQKVQLYKPYFNAQTVKMAHEHGIKCNVFFADDEAEALEYLNMGIDTILTNDYLKISSALKIK